jgi:hypothetical protein
MYMLVYLGCFIIINNNCDHGSIYNRGCNQATEL